MKKNIIAWDLGATKCAAGLLMYDENLNKFHCAQKFSVRLDHTHSLPDLISQIEIGLAVNSSDVDAICIGAAGHYDGAELTHQHPYPYAMPFARIARELQWPVFTVIHDYTSVICATFTDYILQNDNLIYLNQCRAQPYERRIAFGIGTGLGLKDAVLFPNGDFWLSQNEAGHIGICQPPFADHAYNKRHQAIMDFLKSQQGNEPVIFESILSGRGVARLHQFFYPYATPITPEQAGENILNGKAEELLATLAWYAGLFTGTMQLCFLPMGGIYIAGGVTQHLLPAFQHQEFMAGIEASPAYMSLRKQIPMMIMRSSECALYGCGYYAVKRLLNCTTSSDATSKAAGICFSDKNAPAIGRHILVPDGLQSI